MNRIYRRRGFTLVELIAVLGSVVIVISSASVLLIMAFDFSAKNREYDIYHRSQLRFFTDFRQDVNIHGRPEILVNTDKETEGNIIMRWKLKDGELVYQYLVTEIPGTIIQRLETKKEKISRMENYALADHVQIDIYEGTEKNEHLLALSFWQSSRYSEKVKKEELNPFTGKISPVLADQIDPRVLANWRTAIVYAPKKNE